METTPPNSPLPEALELTREQTQLLVDIRAALLRLEKQPPTSVASSGPADRVRVTDLRISFRAMLALVFKFWLASVVVYFAIGVVVALASFLLLTILGPAIGGIFSNIYGSIP